MNALNMPVITRQAVLPEQRPSTGDLSGLPEARRAFGSAVTSGRVSTVLVADPNCIATTALRPALIEYANCRVVEAGSLSAVTDLVASEIVGDVAMVSIRFREHTPAVIRALRATGWRQIVALVPPSADVAPVLEAMQAGAGGVLTVPGLDAKAPGDPVEIPVHGLTVREVEVIALVAEGLSNKEIGAEMQLSALTVKSHLARIGKRLGVGDRAHMVAIAYRAGVLPIDVANAARTGTR